MAHSQRGWTGARTPSAIKRVRQTARKRAINQPRRTAAKSLVARALVMATEAAGNGGATDEVQQAVQRAVSALDRAAKIGAIHRNAADRRKSRLVLKVNAALSGSGVTAPAKMARSTGKAAALKEAKARIAASRAVKAKGAQTAAGKARAALARTTRDTTTDRPAAAEMAAPKTVAAKSPAKGKAAPKASGKTAAKTAAKASAKPAAKASAKPAAKASASKTAAKPATKAKTKK
ncbi:MAG: 30S ribosomal protein S20 [Chloroflexota bacterium]